MKKTHTADMVVEELRLHGFSADIIDQNNYTIHTIFGSRLMSLSERSHMADFYRAVSHIGGMLHKFGLDSKIKENDKIFDNS